MRATMVDGAASPRAVGELLSEMLRALRTQEHQTMQDTLAKLAGILGVQPAAIYKWRQGAAKPNARYLEQLVTVGVEDAKMDLAWAEQVLRLGQHPDRTAILSQLASSSQPVRHNLPRRPYRELRGRDRQRKTIMQLLKEDSPQSVIALEGLGGVGKTTLALDIGWKFVEEHATLRPEERFDTIVWVAFQRQQDLPADTIRRREPDRSLNIMYRTIADMLGEPGLLDFLPSPVDTSSQHNISDTPPTLPLAGSLREQHLKINAATNAALLQKGGRVLLILDNLEELQVSDTPLFEALDDFLRNLQTSTRVLVTTRIHGDMAYPFRLDGLDNDAMLKIVEEQCRDRKVKLPDDLKKELVQTVAGNPLAARWAVGLIATFSNDSGTPPPELGNHQNEVLTYIFDELRNHKNEVLTYIFDEAIRSLRPQSDDQENSGHSKDVDSDDKKHSYLTLLALSFFDLTAGASCDALAKIVLGNPPSLLPSGRRPGDVRDLHDVRQRLGVRKYLVTLNLIVQDGARYKLLPITRGYIKDYLLAQEETGDVFSKWVQQAHERWVEYYLGFTKGHGGADRASWHDENFRAMDSEWANVLLVLDWCWAQSERDDESASKRAYDWLKAFLLTDALGVCRIGAYTDVIANHWKERLDWYERLIQQAQQRQDSIAQIDALSKRCRTLVLQELKEGSVDAVDALHGAEAAERLLTAMPASARSDPRFLSVAFEAAINFATVHIEYGDDPEKADRWLIEAERLNEATRSTKRGLHDELTRRELDIRYYKARRYKKAGKPELAKSYFTSVVDGTGKKATRQWNRLGAAARTELAVIEIELKRLDEAKHHLKEADQLAEREGRGDHRWSGRRKSAWADLLHEGQYSGMTEYEGKTAWQYAEEAAQEFHACSMERAEDEMREKAIAYRRTPG